MGYIVQFCVLTTADPIVKNSNAMEPLGLKKCLESLKVFGINIAILTTDRHVTIRKNNEVSTQRPLISLMYGTWLKE